MVDQELGLSLATVIKCDQQQQFYDYQNGSLATALFLGLG
jgi:hypothetical protein